MPPLITSDMFIASTVGIINLLTNMLHITLFIWPKAEWHGMHDAIALARISLKLLTILTTYSKDKTDG